MGKPNFSDEFKRDAVAQIVERGYPVAEVSQRLGVSPRTYAGYVADLKEEYDAETRFQLGYTMGQQGVSGTEDTD